MKPHVVVFGAEGFLGRALVSSLLSSNHAVLAVSRLGARRFAGPGDAGTPVTLPGDDPTPLLAGAHAVAWMAGTTTPGSSSGKPLLELDDNLRPLAALLASPALAGLSLLFISSGGTVYGNAGAQPVEEVQPLAPSSYYGAGKAAAEFFIEAWTRQGGGHARILRPSNIYGPGQPARPGFGIIPAAMDALRSGRPLTIWGDGSAVRDYLHIDDFTRLARTALLSPPAAGPMRIHAGSGIGVSLLELLATLQRISSRSLDRVHVPSRAVDVPAIILDNAVARREFGWQPRVGLEQGLAETWRWFLSTQP